MKVLSDIYSKSSVVFSSNSLTESKKQKKEESSWLPKSWKSNSSNSNSWYNKIKLINYKMPNYKMPKFEMPKIEMPKLPSFNMSFPKFNLPTVWFKLFLVKLEETRVNCYAYLIELFKLIKEKSSSFLNCSYLKCTCLQFNSNPEYVNFPWYKRVFLTTRDNVNKYVSFDKDTFLSYIQKSKINEDYVKENENIKEEEIVDEENISLDKKGSKAKVDEERISKGNNSDDKYGMKHSQSSKYSNDITTLRSTKKLKKTNTDDLKSGDENNNVSNNVATHSSIKNSIVFSMFSKSDIGNKSATNSLVNKSGSICIDENEKNEENNENKNLKEINEESIQGSNETTTESTKFNIKKTWDKFSKIIS